MYAIYICRIFAIMFGIITFFAPIVGLNDVASGFAFRTAVLFAIVGCWKE